jgi:hypothetical protein
MTLAECDNWDMGMTAVFILNDGAISLNDGRAIEGRLPDRRVAREVMCGEGLGLIQAFLFDDRGDLWRAALFLEKPVEMPEYYSPRADGIRMARFEIRAHCHRARAIPSPVRCEGRWW